MKESDDGTQTAYRRSAAPASVAQSIMRMEASGFIERAARKDDLRANSLRVTEEGARAAANCRQIFDGLEERMFAGFSEEERAQTYALVSRLILNLESEDTDSMNNMELSQLLSSGQKGS